MNQLLDSKINRIMLLRLVSLAMAMAWQSTPCSAADLQRTPVPAITDLAERAMPFWPADGAVIHETPPAFSWPQTPGFRYEIEIRQPSGKVDRRATSRNWLLLPFDLSPGQYSWRMRVESANKSQEGDWRAFTISPDARKVVIPGADELLARAIRKNRPRGLPPLLELRSRQVAGDIGLQKLLRRVNEQEKMPLPIEPTLRADTLPTWAERSAQMKLIDKAASPECRKLLEAAFAWVSTGDTHALDQARRRALHLASWNPTGGTGFKSQDQVSRELAMALATTYDWLFDEFTAAERARLRSAILPRLAEMSGDLLGGQYRIDRDPVDSHGANTLGQVAAICILLAGEAPEIDTCFKETVPRYLVWPIPWGRDDGGFANGTSYATWDFGDAVPVWDLLSKVLNVDLWGSAWGQGYSRYLAYFIPPGTPTGVFGDGADRVLRAEWATQAKAYGARAHSTLSDWYARQQFGEDDLNLRLLTSPRSDWSNALLPAETPNALYIPSIGWVAMHSSLGDRARTSVYFKSSPYGSYNHSHADQNGFVINSRGRALAIDSGYYDFYGSSHWRDWYKQTLAHNAITFDVGQGQLHNTLAAKGQITHFVHSAAFDLVTGDARLAYGGALSRAVRSIAYVRPDVLLVFDALASNTARTWEWNIHALSQMKVQGEGTIEIVQEGARLCVNMLDSPEVSFSQTDRFTAEPSGKYPNQWHGRFSTQAKTTRKEFIALLDVECHRPEVMVRREGGKRVVSVGAKKFVFDESGGVEAAP